MYRRVVSLLLLPFVLMSQSVTFGHCPGGSAGGHDLRPHVHFNAESSHADHGHRHGPCGHHHHHHSEDETTDEGGTPAPAQEPSPCHDSDAVFFGPGDPVVVERAKAEVEAGDSTWLSAVEATMFPCFADLARPSSSHFSHAPPAARPACPLYLRHLALLI